MMAIKNFEIDNKKISIIEVIENTKSYLKSIMYEKLFLIQFMCIK